MGKVRFNSSKKGDCDSKVATALPEVTNTNTKATSFVSSAKSISANWVSRHQEKITSNKDYRTNPDTGQSEEYVRDYTADWPGSIHSSWEAAKSANAAYIQADVDRYNNYATSMQTACNTLTADAKTRIDAIKTLLTALQAAVDSFEGKPVSLEAALEAITNGNLGANIDVSSITLEDGTTVDVVYYVDGDGNKFTIAEMTNAFFTYVGSAMEGAIANELMLDKLGITDEAERAKYRNNYIAGLGNNVYQLLGKGFMSVATTENIEAMYKDAMGSDDIAGDYASMLTESLFKDKDGNDVTGDDIFGAAGVGGVISGGVATAAGAAYSMKKADGTNKMHDDENVEKMEERQKKAAEKAEDLASDPSVSDDSPSDPTDTSTPDESKPDWADTSDPGGNYGGPGGNNGGGPGGDTPTDPGGNTPETDNRFTDLVETELPTEPLEIEFTNEEIDDMARDAFYEKYAVPEDLAERRQQDIALFEELYNSENRDALIQKFQEMGYDAAEAIGAANNKDIGLAAFLLGSQNQELTQIAQDFAKELGLGETFDTAYDNAPDYNDLFDGDAAVELTSPSTSEAIVEAKATLDETKTAYSECVESANQYIEDATKAKDNLDTIRASIEKAAGTDTTKWTDEQIEQYNKAAEDYNTAVTKANEQVEAAEKAKTSYEEAKENLQKVEDEYYDQIREEIQKQNGNYEVSGENGVTSGTTGTTGNDTMNGTTPGGTTMENQVTQQQNAEQDLIDQLFVNM